MYQLDNAIYGHVYTRENVAPPPIVYPVDPLSPGWHHFAMTYDGSVYALWVDAVKVESATTSGDLRYYQANAEGPQVLSPLDIGGPSVRADAGGGSPFAFTGAMADVRLYNRALSAAEIRGIQ